MDDTPEHVKKIQLEIWLAKPPGERLRQFLVDNNDFFKAIEEAKKKATKKKYSEEQSQMKTSDSDNL